MSTNFILERLKAQGVGDNAATADVAGTPADPNISTNPPAATEPGTAAPAGEVPPPVEPAGSDAATVEVEAPEDNDELMVITDPEDDDVATDAAVAEVEDEDAADDDEIDQLSNRLEISALGYQAAATFGLNPAAVAIGQASGLMDGTSLETMGCESFGESEAENGIGIESLGELVASGAGKMGRAVLARSGNWAPRLIGAVDAAAERVSKIHLDHAAKLFNSARVGAARDAAHAAEAAATKAGVDAKNAAVNAARNFSRKAIAHDPAAAETAAKAGRFGGAKTALMIAAGIAAVGGAIAVSMRAMPKASAPRSAMVGWFDKIRAAIAGIKWPFGKLSVQPEAGATGMRGMLGRLFCGGKAAKSAEASASGFMGKAGAVSADALEGVKKSTMSAVETVKGAIKSAGEAVTGSVKVTGEAFDSLVKAPAKAVGDAAKSSVLKAGGSEGIAKAAGVMGHGAYLAGVMAVLGLLAAVVYFVVVGGLRLIRRVFDAG